MDKRTDHLVIGSGIAGLMLALKLAERDDVIVIAKRQLDENATRYAQGGIASAMAQDDSIEQHVADTLNAGAGLCREDVVRRVVAAGPEAIQELIAIGVDFTKSDDAAFPFHLTKEGGHTRRRVLHANDTTGKEIIRALLHRVRTHPRITVLENQIAVDLITTDKYAPDFSANYCLGSYVMERNTHKVYQIRSQKTFLCTGGHGKIYLYTSNPDSATGDGLAMGWRAGCKVANLEFMQFHPTCLFEPTAKTFLISEAVRGEGGVIRNKKGEDFIKAFDTRGSLAPRDIVARAIDLELKKTGETHVYLDTRHLGEERIKSHFPNIHEVCLSHGFDMTKEMVPIVPAAHYSCGGLVVDNVGRTSVNNLYALGEVACTGLHGANRLASNSLLEAVVYAGFASSDALTTALDKTAYNDVAVPAWNVGRAVPTDELVVLSHTWDEIRRLMWHYVGIVRSEVRLKRAYDRLTALRAELDTYYWDYELSEALIEVRNLVQVAWLTTRCAMARKESRGIHYTLDYPEHNDRFQCKDTVLW